MAFEITDANFKEQVLDRQGRPLATLVNYAIHPEVLGSKRGVCSLDRQGVAVLDFWAEWCGPCRMIAPIIEKLAQDYDGKVLVGKVNVDENPEVPMKYGIRSIPTILIFKDGEVVDKHVGYTTQAKLAEKIDAHLVTA